MRGKTDDETSDPAFWREFDREDAADMERWEAERLRNPKQPNQSPAV